ncbi:MULTISPECIES: dihydrolipoamide acetyltransferase family protein [unclassified Arcicella]|uniref:dihydrolipoamide acetyltransferase family protein n=1 Tax=unclassified Arcicella TaxID=2644986 RepID=UPI002865F7D7|nr:MULTISPECIES: dihydrolipoamide acetyltransferase family protein [unclassified Arcicella]MDR6561843.1 2-oxoglutarate dehydrogenase E2 component (dihydrolipoamide succinyltransferase) [Arcicella sp. BE51]MDR6813989.1 2-oxoglutarate dehydrogenase E2 component (dihydrolipoamide succinyltransferase) [Arcicella sp. BE140]MDR6825304.1 2-oxoglutarate dehydrogenase E2 component (dihydrolipoamide succinyltransferase) [Arcicella sp. BE139]
MALIEVIMPKMGESIMEATILKWLKSVGEKIDTDEYLLEVATDKIDTEVPCSQSGVLTEILVQEGEIAEIGKPICIISTDEEEVKDNTKVEVISEQLAQEIEEIKILTGINLDPITQEAVISSNNGSRFYSPLVLSISKEENISKTELDAIVGTGADQRVTKHDILNYLEQRKTTKVITPQAKAPEKILSNASPVFISGNDEIIQMDRMRKMIAERMVDSKRVAPHVTSFVETDMTNVAIWRNSIKDSFKKQYGENITYTPILLEAIVKAIKDFPQINASVDGDRIIYKKNINVGMAVALPNGNLIVPVIHNADSYNLIGLTKKINDLTKRARENKLKPEDLEGGTYTFSNIGTFGNIMGTPIIVQPQVAIMAFGAIQKKPAVIETPQGDLLGIRQKMFISHSYDHRIVDGSLGGQFVKRVSDYLEAFEIDRKL